MIEGVLVILVMYPPLLWLTFIAHAYLTKDD